MSNTDLKFDISNMEDIILNETQESEGNTDSTCEYLQQMDS